MGFLSACGRIISQVLLAFSSYEYGKNTESEDNQIANRNLVAQLQSINKVNESSEPSSATYGVWAIIGLAVAITILVIKEIRKCRRTLRNTQSIEMSARNIIHPNNNDRNNNNGIHVDV